jgi:hypothetical protein
LRVLAVAVAAAGITAIRPVAVAVGVVAARAIQRRPEIRALLQILQRIMPYPSLVVLTLLLLPLVVK